MIALRTDCLLFQLQNGESVPCTPEMIFVEVVGEAQNLIDREMLRHAAASVFHYFKVELEREIVTIAEFSRALEKVLKLLGYTIQSGEPDSADLVQLLREAGDSRELLFFPRLRDELRGLLRQSPRVVRFRGLRGCVKQLAGARRWCHRCEELQDQIIAYLRECFSAEPEQNKCALVVE
jgi:hypothetical protein